MSVCFVANYTKTYFFHEIAKKLLNHGIPVHWIVVNSKIKVFLEENYPKERILYLGLDIPDNNAPLSFDFKLNELISGDRALRHNPEVANEYLLKIQNPIYSFLKRHNIHFIFGERTWAHEVLINRIVERYPDLQTKYLNPHTIRIPYDKFAFFEDEFDSKIFQPILKDAGNLFISVSEMQVKKPDYLLINDKILSDSRSLKMRIKKISRFFTRENIDPYDPTFIHSRWKTFAVKAHEELNREAYKLISKFNISYLDGKKYLVYALHKQPESSIDVTGRYYEDQLLNIFNIWRILPSDYYLAVKEHSNAIGDRGIDFYRKLTEWSRVVLIDERTDSYQLINNGEAVFTVSGTIAIEAALLGKIAFTFVPMFFNGIKKCRNLSNENLRNCKSFIELTSNFQNSYVEKIGPVFPGIISDPISNPSCMSESNIEKVASAIALIIGKI